MEPQASSYSKAAHGAVPTGYGRIIRDEAGNIVDVQLAEEESGDPDVPVHAPLEDLPDPTQDEQLAPWVGLGSIPGSRRAEINDMHVVQGECSWTTIISFIIIVLSNFRHRPPVIAHARPVECCGDSLLSALEQMSTDEVRPKRFTSGGEMVSLRRLVQRHGQDVETMARDRKLNADQRTAGELRRAIERAGGFAELASVS